MNEKQLIRHWASLINESEDTDIGSSSNPAIESIVEDIAGNRDLYIWGDKYLYPKFLKFIKSLPLKLDHGTNPGRHVKSYSIEAQDVRQCELHHIEDELKRTTDNTSITIFDGSSTKPDHVQLTFFDDKTYIELKETGNVSEGEEVDNLLSKAEDGLPVSESEEVNSLMSTAEDGLPVAESEEIDENVDLSQDLANETRNTSDLAYIAFPILQNIVRKVFKLSQTKPSTRFYPRHELHKLLDSMRPGNPKEVKKMDDFLESSGGDERNTVYLVAAISKSGNVDLNGGMNSIVNEFKRISGGDINPTFDTIEMNLKDGRYAVLRFLK